MRPLPKLLVLIVLGQVFALAQTATVSRNVNLRPDPSTDNRPIVLLKRGTQVTLIEAEATDGFYHIKTAAGDEGWVWAQNIKKLQETGGTSGGQGPVTDTQAATSISQDWDKPDPQDTVYEGSEGTCPETGKGGDDITNARKNRVDVPPAYHLVTWDAINAAPSPPESAPRSRLDWTDPSFAATIKPYEGAAISVVGYLNTIKVESWKPSPSRTSGGESTNCHFHLAEDVDWHMPLTAHSGEGEDVAIVVETTPRLRQQHPHWTTAALQSWTYQIRKKDNPEYNNQPVRISGWLMFDPEHWDMVHSGLRSTLWEIHPITKIEVFQNGQWVDLDNLQ